MIKTLSLLRLLNHQTFTSGASIAQTLGTTRTSVSKALRRAETYGVTLQRRQGVGYRLLHPIHWLDAGTIKAQLDTLTKNYHVMSLDEVNSTNQLLLNDTTAKPGTVLAAEWQTQGKGRLGRHWHGELGGSLMFSLKAEFPQGISALSGLSLAVGVAIVRALRQLGVQEAALKWPNDIVCKQGKLGGVLIEVIGDALGPSQAIIGIGLNYHLTRPLLTEQAYANLVQLGLRTDRNTLLAHLLKALDLVLQQFVQSGLTTLMAEWEAMHLWQNKEIDIITAKQTITGTALGITSQGALRVNIKGTVQQFFSGDVSLRGCE
jgi:BirA family biotin operon repressor/biotin-[acetyl-CoA-carboxylase] ligase